VVQHHLEQRHEGDGEPDDLSVTRVLTIIAAAALALGTSGGCGLFASAPAVAMVSGRDDHGLLERPAIGLQASPVDLTVTATAHDGEFAEVVRRDGLYAYVRLLKTGEEGWIADHDLRGEAVRNDPRPRRVTFVAAERRDAAVWVRVRYADDGTEEWVAAASLKEVGAR
jgi:hypothetical protein